MAAAATRVKRLGATLPNMTKTVMITGAGSGFGKGASLKTLGTDPLALLERANIEPTSRAEEISPEAFVALARALAAR